MHIYKIGYSILIILVLTTLLVNCGKSPEEEKEQSKEVLINTILGLGYLEDNDLDIAEIAFKRVIELAPDESSGYANLGLVCLRLGRIEEAEQNLLKAIDLEDDNPDIRLILAKAYEMNEKIDESVEQLHYNLKLDSAHVKTLFELAGTNLIQDETERIKYLRRLTRIVPGNIVIKLQLIELILKGNDSDEALAILEDMQSQFPEFPPESIRYYQAAVELLHTGNLEEASINYRMFYNYMKTSPVYQAGFTEFEGPGENLTGFPIISYDPLVLWNEDDSTSSIIELMSFTDITSSIGLALNAKYSTLLVTDYDGDGDYDLYLGSGGDNGKPRIFRNKFGHYEDITSESGLTHSGKESTSMFRDFDNDGFLDLLIIKNDEYILYRNYGDGTFNDVTEKAMLHNSGGGYGAVGFDLDHEGDLDLLVVGDQKIAIYRNNGDDTFINNSSRARIDDVQEEYSDVDFGDFDGDGTTDFVVANSTGDNLLFKNLRSGQFENLVENKKITIGANGRSVTAEDYNNDGFLDLIIINSNGDIEFYNNSRSGSFVRDSELEKEVQKDHKVGSVVLLDFDNDGLLDLIIMGESQNAKSGRVRLLHNEGNNSYKDVSYLLPQNLVAKASVPFDFDDDGDLDLFFLGDDNVRLLRNEGGNTNHYLKISLVGLRNGSGKNNHFGVGSKVEVRTGNRYQMKIVTEPVTYFGLGTDPVAEVVRIQWTNGVPQNIYFPKGDATLLEEQLLKGSCPFLYTWDGEKYVFVKDFLWRSALGMPLGIMGESAAYAFPDAASEYVKIPGEMLKEKDGMYNLQVTSELWEAIYIDKLELVVVDHPASYEVYVDEKFSPPPYPEHLIYKVEDQITPKSAIDEKGNDLTKLISKKDDRYIANFKHKEFQGIVETTELIIDPGEDISTENLCLFMNGWIFPSDASINTAISQSDKTQMIAPELQVLNSEGEWQIVNAQVGFPMGKNKTIIIDLSDVFLSRDKKVKIKTNLQIYWDQIFFANVDYDLQLQTINLPVNNANLHYRGYSAMERKGGRYGPHWFDYSNVTTGQQWLDLDGNYTRYGDVQTLLTEADDMYVVSNSGDEMTVSFDASKVPNLPDGWKRDYLIYSEGWVKDGDLNTAYGNTVDLLPFHGMTQYPYNPDEEHYPDDSEHRSYLENYNSRYVNTSEYGMAVKGN